MVSIGCCVSLAGVLPAFCFVSCLEKAPVWSLWSQNRKSSSSDGDSPSLRSWSTSGLTRIPLYTYKVSFFFLSDLVGVRKRVKKT